jgi:uncharacterized membrane protein YbaN (DUF454 family)
VSDPSAPIASPAPTPRKRNWFVFILGWIFLVLGVLGLFLPFLQGVLFLLVGLFLLSREVEWARRLRVRVLDRFPQAKPKVRRAEAYARATLARWRRKPKA